MQAAAEDRLHPIADLSKIDAYKQYFLRCAKAICPGYIVRDDQRNILNDIVHWALKDYDGKLDPDRGLLLWGDIGTGKSTLLRIIRQFCHDIRPPKDGMRYWFRMTNVIDICAEFSDESRDGGYYAIQTYITSSGRRLMSLAARQHLPDGGATLRMSCSMFFSGDTTCVTISLPMPLQICHLSNCQRFIHLVSTTDARKCSISWRFEARRSEKPIHPKTMARRRTEKKVNISTIDRKRLYTISEAARILGVSRSYFYYCFDHDEHFPKPTLVNGMTRLNGNDIIEIIALRGRKGL